MLVWSVAEIPVMQGNKLIQRKFQLDTSCTFNKSIKVPLTNEPY